MSTIHIEICTDNAAFDDDLSGEVQRILNGPDLINRLSESGRSNSIGLMDVNGNTVGHAWVTS